MATMMAVPVGQYQQQMCIQCNAKPRYFDGVKLHDFCGKMCAGNFAAAGGGQGMMQAPMMGMATNAGQFQQQQQQPPPSQMQVQMQPAPAADATHAVDAAYANATYANAAIAADADAANADAANADAANAYATDADATNANDDALGPSSRNATQQAKATGQFISTAPPQAPSFFPQLQAPPQAGPPQMTPQQKAAAGLCQLPNCSAPVWVDARGSRSQYCGKKHMNQAQGGGGGAAAGPSTYGAPGPSAPLAALVNPCLICKNREQWQGSMFCGRGCLKKAQAQAPSLLEIPTTHPKFKDVENQFTSKWVGSPVPTVKAVYMVMTSESDMKKFEAYRDKIEAKNNHKSRGREPGNQQRRWHGTTRVC
ncbi:hypothetical protein FRC17_010322, partial [Serendipita sp. 399]